MFMFVWKKHCGFVRLPCGAREGVIWKTTRIPNHIAPNGCEFIGGVDGHRWKPLDLASLSFEDGDAVPEEWRAFCEDMASLGKSSRVLRLSQGVTPRTPTFLAFTEDQAAEYAYREGLRTLDLEGRPVKGAWQKLLDIEQRRLRKRQCSGAAKAS